jgi:colanic acid/amylovoran biosynthesis glycosyltransferase
LNTFPAVGHVLDTYLPNTENWIYEQLRVLYSVRTVVFARRCRAQRFPVELCAGALDGSLPRALSNRVLHRTLGYYPIHARIARRENVALLHAHFGPVGVRALALARHLSVPLLTSFYGVDLCRDQERLPDRYRRLFQSGAGFIVEGEAARAQLESLGCPPARIRVHRLGIDLNVIRPVQRSPGDNRLRVLMAGRFAEKKGMIHGLEAFARAARECAGIRLTIIGRASRKPAEQQVARALESTVKRHGLQKQVRFVGMLPPTEFRAQLAQHDVLVQPSIHAPDGDCEGGLPVTILEAAATAMPIIASRHCDIVDVVRAGHTGWLAEERDVETLAAAICEAARQPETRQQYGANARTLIESRYDVRLHTLDQIYREFLTSRTM